MAQCWAEQRFARSLVSEQQGALFCAASVFLEQLVFIILILSPLNRDNWGIQHCQPDSHQAWPSKVCTPLFLHPTSRWLPASVFTTPPALNLCLWWVNPVWPQSTTRLLAHCPPQLGSGRGGIGRANPRKCVSRDRSGLIAKERGRVKKNSK